MNGRELLHLVQAFCVRNQLTETAFGRRFAGDPNFVFDLKAGREPREKKKATVLARMEAGK